MKKFNVIWLFVLITIGYFAIVGFSAKIAQLTGYDLALSGGLGPYIETHKLNTLGDFLAGIFSPLALLWLVAAVIIQSQELRLQREEIAENRRVMNDQAVAAEAQAKFLNEQTAAMKEQTTLLIRQTEIADKSAQRNHKIAMFEKRIDTYQSILAAGSRVHGGNFDISKILKDVSHSAEFLFDADFVAWLSKMLEVQRSHHEKYWAIFPDIQYKSEDSYSRDERDGLRDLREVEEWIRNELSDSAINARFNKFLSLRD